MERLLNRSSVGMRGEGKYAQKDNARWLDLRRKMRKSGGLPGEKNGCLHHSIQSGRSVRQTNIAIVFTVDETYRKGEKLTSKGGGG